MCLEWLHGLAVCRFGALVGDAEHLGLARAVDVGVENPDARAFPSQGEGEVDGRRALAHAAFARSDGDDIFHAVDASQVVLHGMGQDPGSQFDMGFGNFRLREQGGFDLGLHPGLAARGRIGEFDLDFNASAF